MGFDWAHYLFSYGRTTQTGDAEKIGPTAGPSISRRLKAHVMGPDKCSLGHEGELLFPSTTIGTFIICVIKFPNSIAIFNKPKFLYSNYKYENY